MNRSEFDVIKDISDTLAANNDSATTANESSAQRPFLPKLWVQLLWFVFFAVLIMASFIGNTIVIWAIVAHKHMRTVTNWFLFNLSVADLLTVIFNVSFNFVFMLYSHWPFGHVYCIFNNVISFITVPASVFTLSVTSVDR